MTTSALVQESTIIVPITLQVSIAWGDTVALGAPERVLHLVEGEISQVGRADGERED